MQPKNKSVFKTYLVYFIAMMLFCGLRIISSLGLLDGIKTPWQDIVFTLIIQVGIMFLVPFVLYMLLLKKSPKSIFKTCNYTKTNISTILLAFALGIVLFLLNLIVSTIFNGVISFSGYRTPLTFEPGATPDYSVGNFFLTVLLVAVLPAIFEEFLHRGLLLQGTKHIGFGKAIIISSICFGLIHFNIMQFGFATILGLVMGFAGVVSKNIWVPTIMHFTNNFISVYLEFATANGWFLGDYSKWFEKLGSTSFILVCIVCFVALCLVALALFYLITLLFKQSILRKINRAIEKVYDKDKNLNDEPVMLDKNKVLHEMLENNTMINLNYEEMKSPLEIVMPRQKNTYKTDFKDNIFLICALFLGGLVTLFTFMWGFF